MNALLLIFAKGTLRYVHFFFGTIGLHEEGMKVKRNLGSGWILYNVQDPSDVGGLMFDTTVDVQEKCRLEITKKEAEELELYCKMNKAT